MIWIKTARILWQTLCMMTTGIDESYKCGRSKSLVTHHRLRITKDCQRRYINIYIYIYIFCFLFSEYIFFWKNTVDINPGLFPSHFKATSCRLWSTSRFRNKSSVVNSMQELSEIAVVQISRAEYIMKCYHDMINQIPQKLNLGPWKNLNPIDYMWHLKFAHERCVTLSEHKGTLA